MIAEKSKKSAVHLAKPFFVEPRAPHPYDSVEWVRRDVVLTDAGGKVLFEMHGVEAPAFWSDLSVRIAATKYFRIKGTPENSIRQMLARVSETIAQQAAHQGYLEGDEMEVYERELAYLLVHQMGAFNSPVWFNVGVNEKPQASACFINSVEDSMDSILDLAKVEGMLFKHGSGTGTNLSPLRSSREKVAAGGQASGPVSFMRGYDAFAGVIKSGGKTRRAAKMAILNISHPDVVEFIRCKAEEEKKARVLMANGYTPGLEGEAYSSVFFQNGNNSVRLTDEFMQAVEADGDWSTRAVVDGRVIETFKARDLLRKLAEAAHLCGDPGVQFDTAINAWHTCPNSGRIEASNPCSEFMFLNDSACNLASVNLLNFWREGKFQDYEFSAAVDVFLLAQDVLVDYSSYPTARIAENSRNFRPLGLGYSNLGAFFLVMGYPYDSEAGRNLAAAITSLMSAAAYRFSGLMARKMGAFKGWADNQEPMTCVISQHSHANVELLDRLGKRAYEPGMGLKECVAAAHSIGVATVAARCWEEAEAMSGEGFRNAQVTVLAPTGTISFLMGCSTTGIEPAFALVAYKAMAGGGTEKLVVEEVWLSLRALGYDQPECTKIVESLVAEGHLENSGIKPDYLPVFDTANPAGPSKRALAWQAHLTMMAAVQPFLSGAISKTVNLPESATVEELEKVIVESWKLKLKAVAIYRDNSKGVQVLSTQSRSSDTMDLVPKQSASVKRHRLPETRGSVTHRFEILAGMGGSFKGYFTVGLFKNGQPGELFINTGKQGTLISGLLDAFATSASLGLQYGVPLEALVDKLAHQVFEPHGFTAATDQDLKTCTSVVDYLARWLRKTFLDQPVLPLEIPTPVASERVVAQPDTNSSFSGGVCQACGGMLIRTGKCQTCTRCGQGTGCS